MFELILSRENKKKLWVIVLFFRLDQELDFIKAQQQELEEMLKPLEETVNTSSLGGRQLQQADKERDFT